MFLIPSDIPFLFWIHFIKLFFIQYTCIGNKYDVCNDNMLGRFHLFVFIIIFKCL